MPGRLANEALPGCKRLGDLARDLELGPLEPVLAMKVLAIEHLGLAGDRVKAHLAILDPTGLRADSDLRRLLGSAHERRRYLVDVAFEVMLDVNHEPLDARPLEA